MTFHFDGIYFARPGLDISRTERSILRNAGWRFDPLDCVWATTDDDKAFDLEICAAPSAQRRLTAVRAEREAMIAPSEATDHAGDFPVPDGLAYLPYQKAGIAYATARDRCLIADPPGLGKTIQAIGVHNALDTVRNLIICPASLKENWSREWQKWSVADRPVGIAYSKSTSKGTEYVWPDTPTVIINYDMLPAFDHQVKGGRWDFMVCDEAHAMKNEKTLRAYCVWGGRRAGRRQDGRQVRKPQNYEAIRADRHLYLTGTPIMSRPIELWPLARVCDPSGLGKNYNDYAVRYCDGDVKHYGDAEVFDVSGASNLEELQFKLRTRFMLRRDKKKVLAHLPPKRRSLIALPQEVLKYDLTREKDRVQSALETYEAMTGSTGTMEQHVATVTQELEALIAAQSSEEQDWNEAVQKLSPPSKMLFVELSTMREEVALAKVDPVTEHVCNLVNSEEPVILFAHHTSVIEALTAKLGKTLRVGAITGKVSSAKRQPIVDSFQSGELDVIIGNIAAMGTGFTLTRSSCVVFAEMDWVPAMIEQAEDRAWRLGQVNSVLVQHIVANGSIEARMCEALIAKMEVISASIDR